MKRSYDRNFIAGVIRNFKYIPTIMLRIRNWPTYFLCYLGFKRGDATYVFRNGITLRDRDGAASGTIAVVFIRQQYGRIEGRSTIIEIGANVGIFAVFAASTDPRVRIYSYEPIPENFELLSTNITKNNLQDRIIAFNLGVAGTRGTRNFAYQASSPEHSFAKINGNGRSVAIDCLSLRDIITNNNITKVDLLKINAEGAEYEILYSTPTECFDKIEEIRMEYHDGENVEGHDLSHLKSFLEQIGYTTLHLYEHTPYEGFIWLKRHS